MKKLLVFVLILACITALASCGGENGDNNQNGGSKNTLPCKHFVTEVLEGRQPTCTAEGFTDGEKCKICGVILVSQTVIEKLECTESDWIIDREPTLEEDGQKHTECTGCGKIMREEAIPSATLVELTPAEFIEYYSYFLESTDLGDSISNDVRLCYTVNAIMNGSHTAEEFCTLVSKGGMEGAGFSKFQVEQMYGLYFWESINDGKTEIQFETIVDFMAIDLANDENAKALIDSQTAEDLLELSEGLDDFKYQMNNCLTKEEFREFGKAQFGDSWLVQTACDTLFDSAKKTDGKAKMVDILRTSQSVSSFLFADYAETIEGYLYVYDVIQQECSYEEFIPTLQRVVASLSDTKHYINVDNSAVQQAYIMYFNKLGLVSNGRIFGGDFVSFVIDTANTNPTISANVSEDSKLRLQDIVLINEFLSDTNRYTYDALAEKFSVLKESLKTDIISSNAFDADRVLSIYCFYYAVSK